MRLSLSHSSKFSRANEKKGHIHRAPIGLQLMDEKQTVRRPGAALAAAFAVHVFTACGAACALLALIAAVHADWTRMFSLLGLALIIDGVDGTLARRLRVAERLPRWSGELLDFVVDFATYVFVPAYAIAAGGLLPPSVALPLGLIVTVTGALYFADRRMKTADNYFRGFPALWNVVAFYLFLLKPVQSIDLGQQVEFQQTLLVTRCEPRFGPEF